MYNIQINEMCEMKLERAEKRELTENARDSRKMHETWQGWCGHAECSNTMCNN